MAMACVDLSSVQTDTSLRNLENKSKNKGIHLIKNDSCMVTACFRLKFASTCSRVARIDAKPSIKIIRTFSYKFLLVIDLWCTIVPA